MSLASSLLSSLFFPPQPRRPCSPAAHVAILSWGVGDASKVLAGAGVCVPPPLQPGRPGSEALHRPPRRPRGPGLAPGPDSTGTLRSLGKKKKSPGNGHEPQLGAAARTQRFRSLPPRSSPVPGSGRPRVGPRLPRWARWSPGPPGLGSRDPRDRVLRES